MMKRIIFCIIAGTAFVSSTAAACTMTNFTWTIANSSVNNVASANKSVAQATFDVNTVRISAPSTSNNVEPKGWVAQPTLNVKSYAQLSNIITGLPHGKYTTIEYDPEFWSATPKVEQQNPCLYAQKFGTLAHQYGYVAEEDPATDLGNAVSHKGETNIQWFINSDIAGCVATYVDIFDRQAQTEETNTATYQADVQQTASQAKAANSQVIDLSNLTPNVQGKNVSASQLTNDANAVRPYVQGFFLNVGGTYTDKHTTVSFLQNLGY